MSREQVGACPKDAHVLVVSDFDPEDPTACFEVVHRANCPAFGDRVDGSWVLTGYTCGVGFHVAAAGIETWFRHQDQPSREAINTAEPLPTGSHVIAPWSRRVRTFDFEEWDGGLESIDASPDEVAS